MISKRMIFVLSLLQFVSSVWTKAVTFPRSKKQIKPNEVSALVYLFKYGYVSIEDFRNNVPLQVKSIKTFQEFADLTPTGHLDDATIRQMSFPRCGMLDPIQQFQRQKNSKFVNRNNRMKRFILGKSSWKPWFERKRENKLKWTLLNKCRTLPRETVLQLLRRAFTYWEAVTNVDFEEVTKDEIGQPGLEKDNIEIFVSFVDGGHGDPYHFDGEGETFGHAFYPHMGNGLSGDIHFDNDENFTNSSSHRKDFLWVATHEIGHSLGLEHSGNSESIMFPWYTVYRPDFKLNADDILGIQSLYGTREEPSPPESPSALTKTNSVFQITLKTTETTKIPTTESEQETVTTETTPGTTISQSSTPETLTAELLSTKLFTSTLENSVPQVSTREPFSNKRLTRTEPTTKLSTQYLSTTEFSTPERSAHELQTTTHLTKQESSSPTVATPELSTQDSSSTLSPKESPKTPVSLVTSTLKSASSKSSFDKQETDRESTPRPKAFFTRGTGQISTQTPTTSSKKETNRVSTPNRETAKRLKTITSGLKCRNGSKAITGIYFSYQFKINFYFTKADTLFFLRSSRRKTFTTVSRPAYLPQIPDPIDAIFIPYQESRSKEYQVFFSGDSYFLYRDFGASVLPKSGPYPIHGSNPLNLKFPKSINRIDAAMTWQRNNKTYLFSGPSYWRYDSRSKRMDDGYPQLIKDKWERLASHVDAAHSSRDQKKTFFIVGDQYYLMDDE